MSWVCNRCRSVNDNSRVVCHSCGDYYEPAAEMSSAAVYDVESSLYVHEVELTEYAGFFRRTLAFFIDCAIMIVPILLLNPYVGVIGHVMADFLAGDAEKTKQVIERLAPSFILVLTCGVYYAAMESSSLQGTIGKMAVNIKVVDEYNERISFLRASMRYLFRYIYFTFIPIIYLMAFIIGQLALYVLYGAVFFDYICAAITEKNQTIHDKMAGTYVVKIK